MDANVIAAMARWPEVADVYGWLSLTENGQWRLHPRGDGWRQNSDAQDAAPRNDTVGESITNPQILQFIDRNYACDERGQWFFQNGPQKVYVRLDAAPYILRSTGAATLQALGLRTHNGLEAQAIQAWWLDDAGKLYAQTEHGPGLIAGRDLPGVLDKLRTAQGTSLLKALELDPGQGPIALLPPDDAPSARVRPTDTHQPEVFLNLCAAAAIPGTLSFVRHPQAKK